MNGSRGMRCGVSIISLVAATLFAVWPAPASALDFVGIAQMAGLDQPRINLMLSASPGNPLTTERLDLVELAGGNITPIPTVNVQAYFDTGASGILLGDYTATQLGVPRAQHGGQSVSFEDVGIAGTDSFAVSEPLYVGLAPFQPFIDVDSPASYTQLLTTMRAQIGPIRATTNPSNDELEALIQLLTLQEFNVVGMPAMAGKNIVIDARHTNHAATILAGGSEVLNDIINGGDIEALASFLNSLELRSYVYNPGTPFQPATADTNPGIPAVSHQVKLSYASFDEYTQVTPAGAPGPTLAHNPFIGPNPILNSPSDNTPKVQLGMGAQSTDGSFLLDTGAAVSIISTQLAADLNVRYVDGTQGTANAALEIFDPISGTYVPAPDQFTLTVGGVGGQSTLAGLFLDSLLLPVMGENGEILPPDDPRHFNFVGAPVLIHDIVLHHPDPNQTVVLDGIFGMNYLVASVNVAFEGTSVSAAGYTPGAFDWITFDEPNGILGLKLSSAFQSTPGDFDGDGDVDGADFVAWQTNFPTASGATLAMGDSDGDGDVDGADFIAWQTNFPFTPNGGISPVPEPANWTLALLCLAAWPLIRHTRLSA